MFLEHSLWVPYNYMPLRAGNPEAPAKLRFAFDGQILLMLKVTITNLYISKTCKIIEIHTGECCSDNIAVTCTDDDEYSWVAQCIRSNSRELNIQASSWHSSSELLSRVIIFRNSNHFPVKNSY